MDGISLDGIMEMLRPMLPMLSYYINYFSKLFDIFTSYLGFDLTVPEEEIPETEV